MSSKGTEPKEVCPQASLCGTGHEQRGRGGRSYALTFNRPVWSLLMNRSRVGIGVEGCWRGKGVLLVVRDEEYALSHFGRSPFMSEPVLTGNTTVRCVGEPSFPDQQSRQHSLCTTWHSTVVFLGDGNLAVFCPNLGR